MTNNNIKALIDKLNRNKSNDSIHLRPISKNVEFAKVWVDMPKPTDEITYPDGPLNFYFIKNENSTYIGSVLDMEQDLHWYILQEYRGNGYLTKAMKNVIIPHLLQKRNEQKITIDETLIGFENFKSSENVAINLGFVKVSDREYVLSKKNFENDKKVTGWNLGLSEERVNELQKKINYLARTLWVIQTEVEMKLGDDEYSEKLKNLVDEIKKHSWLIEDIWYDSRDK